MAAVRQQLSMDFQSSIFLGSRMTCRCGHLSWCFCNRWCWSHGQLAPGLAADYLILDMMAPECLPSHDFEWELVRVQVIIDAVIIDGQICMENGRPEAGIPRNFAAAMLLPAITSASVIKRCHGALKCTDLIFLRVRPQVKFHQGTHHVSV